MMQTRYSVLIADDEAVIRNGLMSAIPWEVYNAQVIGVAANGQDALAMVQELKPDLAVMDIKMPVMDGLEVIRRAGEMGAKTRFIILSGYDDFTLAQKAIRYGASAYFLKPLRIEEFKDELSRQLQGIARDRRQSEADDTFDVLLQSSRVFLLNQLILNEIRGQDEMERRCGMVGLNWLEGCYRAVVCSAAQADEVTMGVLKERVAAVCGGIDHQVWLHGSDTVVAVAAGTDEDFLATKKKLAGALAELKQRLGLRVYAGVGKMAQGAEQAAMSYASALRALSYHLYETADEVYDNTMICRQEPPLDAANISFEPLVSAMEQCDQAAVEAFCGEYLQRLFFVPMPPPDFIRSMCIHLVNTARIQFLSRHAQFQPVIRMHAEEIRQCHSMADLSAWMKRCVMLLAGQYREYQENSDPIISRAKAFIRDNISANIKARDVAAAVNLSESYFTVYFKQKTDENFRDYLLSVRIDLARSLLAEGRLTVGEIAAEAGYQDYRSFSRAFKNVTGVSPSEYNSP